MTLRTVEELLDDLSYSLSTPEAQHMISLIEQDRRSRVHVILRRYLSKEEIETVIDHYRNIIESDIELVEIKISDIPVVEDDQKYIFRAGLDLTPAASLYLNEGVLQFYSHKGFLPLSKAQQAWKLVKK
jgi:hypothetical protein